MLIDIDGDDLVALLEEGMGDIRSKRTESDDDEAFHDRKENGSGKNPRSDSDGTR
jgi:hypothetical protein